MRIISFAWTTEALLAGKKTVTRRFWTYHYAQRFHKGDVVAAWDKSPRFGGKRIATICLTADPYKQSLYDVTDEDERKEGGLWGSGSAYMQAMFNEDKGHMVWVIEFELVKEQT